MNAIEEKNIRRLVLERKASDIRSLLLADSQVDFLKDIERLGDVTSSLISSMYDISVQNASTKLAGLHSKGYLDRRTDTHGTGGIEHIYTLRDISFQELHLQS